MKKHHALALSLLLTVATVVGVVALTKTVSLGQQTPVGPSAAQLDRRAAALDRARREIARLDASIPPALPPSTSLTRTAAPAVVVVRAQAAPSAAEGSWEGEHEHGESGGEGEEGWDD